MLNPKSKRIPNPQNPAFAMKPMDFIGFGSKCTVPFSGHVAPILPSLTACSTTVCPSVTDPDLVDSMDFMDSMDLMDSMVLMDSMDLLDSGPPA